MNNTKKSTCKGLRKTKTQWLKNNILRGQKNHKHDQEKQGANMQTRLTPTSFCSVAIKETLEGFFHCPYFYYNFFLTK